MAEVDRFRGHGFGGTSGLGRRPALIVVDLIRGFTDPSSSLGSDLDDAVAATEKLIVACHERGLPVAFTTVSYRNFALEAGPFGRKVPALAILREGSPWVEIDQRLSIHPTDLLIVKKQASAFFGTPLAAQLQAAGVDSAIVCGATTSGCVRATALDAMQYGFATVVVKEAVGDRSAESHRVSLADLAAKYADVMTLDEVLATLAAAD